MEFELLKFYLDRGWHCEKCKYSIENIDNVSFINSRYDSPLSFEAIKARNINLNIFSGNSECSIFLDALKKERKR